MKLTGINDLDLTHASRKVFISFGLIPKDLANFAARLNLDYDGSVKEVNPYESHRVYMATWDNAPTATSARSSATHQLPHLSNAPMLNTILAQIVTESSLCPRNLNSDFQVA